MIAFLLLNVNKHLLKQSLCILIYTPVLAYKPSYMNAMYTAILHYNMQYEACR